MVHTPHLLPTPAPWQLFESYRMSRRERMVVSIPLHLLLDALGAFSVSEQGHVHAS